MNTKRLFYLIGFVLLAILAPVGYLTDRLATALPKMDGEIVLPFLSAPVEVDFDSLAIPSAQAHTREDAYRVLGYLHARDRLFQMDLMRRKSAGRLAEVFGNRALTVDQRQRVYGFQQVAEAIVKTLPIDQRKVLDAYVAGVNAFIETAQEPGFEFRLLRYHPERWRAEDSFLVALGMFQTLNGYEQEERMLTVMERLLPPEVTAFLTPDTDEYARTLLGGDEANRPELPIPVTALAALKRETEPRKVSMAVQAEPISLGSNNWVVGASKTQDGRAIVANDMHLPLNVPNIWYRARLRYGNGDLTGVTLPGVPLVVVGSNGHIAWGFTNIDADLLDLVRLEINPANPEEYLTPGGWESFERRVETIVVKDGDPVTIELKKTRWGPLSPEPLLGDRVAIHWTALEPEAVNLSLLNMDTATDLEQAIALFNRAGAPPQNVVMADEQGHIAWTYMGFFPRRRGFDGSLSVSWGDGRNDWNGYIAPDELPRLIDPPEGFIATANNRTLGKGYPYVIAHAFSNSYRAYRITQQLKAKNPLAETDLFAMQLDTVSEFYEFYRQLALPLLSDSHVPSDPSLEDARIAIERWNGRLNPDSMGIGLLVRWRQELVKALFSPWVSRCVSADPTFMYSWREQETPLRSLLRARLPETLPQSRFTDWSQFLLETLRSSVETLKNQYGVQRIQDLAWGRVNSVQVSHPFGQSFSLASRFLDMPMEGGGACNSFCLKVLHDNHGASERLVVSPNHFEDGILHMPGGQSGNPLSPHYRDQQEAWAKNQALPFWSAEVRHRLRFKPKQDSRTESVH
jgi:penicillin amidase